MSENTKMSNFRWTICLLLFAATTVNYLDRQVLSLTFPEFIQPEFHWTDAHYGMITGFFSPYRLEIKDGMVMASSFTL